MELKWELEAKALHPQNSAVAHYSREVFLSTSKMVSLPSFHVPQYTCPNQNLHGKPLSSQTLRRDLLHSFSSPFELSQVHAQIIKAKAPLSILPLTRVGLVCSFTPSFHYAQQIFERLEGGKKREASVWNSCLKSLAEGDSPIDAVLLFYWLRQYDIWPDDFTFSFVLKACLNLSDLSNGRILHGVIEKLGFQSNLFLLNMIVHLYASCGEMGVARLLFEKMPQRDVVTWNTMIAQFIRQRDYKGAYDLFFRMPERNVRSWTSMISGYVHCGKAKEAIHLFGEMEEAVVKCNEVTVIALLAACADQGALDMKKRNHEYSKSTWVQEECPYFQYSN